MWLGPESNRRHADFQSAALPTELPSLFANETGFSSVLSNPPVVYDKEGKPYSERYDQQNATLLNEFL